MNKMVGRTITDCIIAIQKMDRLLEEALLEFNKLKEVDPMDVDFRLVSEYLMELTHYSEVKSLLIGKYEELTGKKYDPQDIEKIN